MPAPRARTFAQVDVFTQVALRGNPVAVVLDGEGLDDAAMQAFASWTQLSETTFVLPPTPAARAAGADYQLRIFTPGGELPFAGHPTLGSCHAWLAHGGKPQSATHIVQECKKGLVSIARQGDGTLAFAAPALARSAPEPQLLAAVLQALALTPDRVIAAEQLDNGPLWLGLLLDSPETVLALDPDHARLKALGQKVGVAALYPAGDAPALIKRSSREARAFAQAPARAAVQLEVRAFAAATGINEDPVTGSLNASLAQWLIAEGRLQAPYVASQGSCLGRDGWVHVAADEQGRLWIGGQTVGCIQGTVLL
ncbi:PhzF family phenazine biosynthesis protein [Comamonas endophytica]|uniref:PhzF family phenazine biosynthesis protein n=1 Tax=Comamonas endophytica TaxID=2949090 RepID=A0ABY6GCW4_9BURK|nr:MULTISPECIES: PhzF family phenazine biosynthesis protein [unclassified Acidovorax]MCD2512712.1 PhzF family phenazine biosynthesis protein [Acidovorax sp. D4N7]UYG52936.1 PhzF family phenazine biosynthesis protein [Acidovorax sp. 5MLIR]